MERGNSWIRAYLSFIRHKYREAVCNLELVNFNWYDARISFKNPKLVYSRSSEMYRQQIYRDQGFYVEWMRGYHSFPLSGKVWIFSFFIARVFKMHQILIKSSILFFITLVVSILWLTQLVLINNTMLLLLIEGLNFMGWRICFILDWMKFQNSKCSLVNTWFDQSHVTVGLEVLSISISVCYYLELCGAITIQWECDILPSKVICVL